MGYLASALKYVDFHGEMIQFDEHIFLDWVVQPPTGSFLALLFCVLSNFFWVCSPPKINSCLAPESHDGNGTRHPLSFLVCVGLLFRGKNRIKKHP